MEFTVQQLKKEQIPQVIPIWQQAYGDDESYIKAFFDHRYDNIISLGVLDSRGLVRSFGAMLPCFFRDADGMEENAYFCYALCTDKDFKHHGFARALNQGVIDLSNREGAQLFFHSRTDSLASFYETLGFCPLPNDESLKIPRFADAVDCNVCINQGNGDCSFRSCTPEEYTLLRDNRFASLKCGYLRWDEEAVDWVIKENHLCGGDCLAFCCNGETGAVIFRLDKKANVLYVQESTFGADNFLPSLQLLLSHFSVDYALLNLPRELITSDLEPYIYQNNALRPMIYPNPKKQVYINLTLD